MKQHTGFPTTADAKWRIGPNRTSQIVFLDRRFGEDSVDIKFETRSFAGSVVGYGDMGECFGGKIFICLNVDEILRPTMDQMHTRTQAMKLDIPAASTIFVIHLAKRSTALGLNGQKRGDTKRLILFESESVPILKPLFACRMKTLADRSGLETTLAIFAGDNRLPVVARAVAIFIQRKVSRWFRQFGCYCAGNKLPFPDRLFLAKRFCQLS